MYAQKLVPHFVADRPMSLRILIGLDLILHPVKIGLMAQACTSQKFREMVSNFPCVDLNYCGVVDGICPYNGEINCCPRGLALKRSVTKIADSGVFTKNGSPLSYPDLFSRYQDMNVQRGIILDVLGNMEGTIESAKLGWEYYSKENYDFNLIGVAQGKNVDEYLICYENLVNIGYDEIAIGGLLTKKNNTARYASSNKNFISDVVKRIKFEWPERRCFTLGVYNPKRHEFLEDIGVDAADYKGWIFQYKRNYQDPLCHHIDRLHQTRIFIEKTILSQMSGNNISERRIQSLAKSIKNKFIKQNTRVIVENKDNPLKNGKKNRPDHIVIISCGKSKNHESRCLAKDAYNGKSFLLKRKYAELSGFPWLILSAKYGLLKPDSPINPNYDVTLTSKKEIADLTRIVEKQIPELLEFSIADEIIFLGPESYVKVLENADEIKSIKINHITKGLRQGNSQKRIKELIEKKSKKNLLISV